MTPTTRSWPLATRIAALLAAGLAAGLPALADDSGLCVPALGGAPGVRSARYAADAGAGMGDAANNAHLVAQLATRGIPDGAAGRAAATCCAMTCSAAEDGTRPAATCRCTAAVT